MPCVCCVHICIVCCVHICAVCCVHICAVCCVHICAMCTSVLCVVCISVLRVCVVCTPVLCVVCTSVLCVVWTSVLCVCCVHICVVCTSVLCVVCTSVLCVVCTSVPCVLCAHLCCVLCAHLCCVCVVCTSVLCVYCVHICAVRVVCVHFDAHTWLRDPWPLLLPGCFTPAVYLRSVLAVCTCPRGTGGAIPSVGMDTQARLRGQPAAEQGVPASILKGMLSREHGPGPLILARHSFGLFPRRVPLPAVRGCSGPLTATSTHSVLSPSTRVHRRQFPGFSLNQSDS